MPEPTFTQSILAGAPTGNWTSLQFGPDGRLYASQVDGSLYAFTIEAAPDGGYRVASTEAINVVRTITNYNDDGTLAAPEVQDAGRLVTGILAVAGGGAATAAASGSTGTTSLAAATATGEAAPVVVEPRVAASVPQGSPVGTVAADVDASDPAGTPVTYSFTPGLGGGGAWAINPATGVVTVADPSRLDASDPDRQVYRLGVDATDAQGDTASTSVFVAVAEAPPPGAEPAPASVPTAAAVAAAPDTPVVLYVSSSDPRFGSQQDVGLDTNSGVVSRLERGADGGWTRVDLVRGLPSSESDHAVNGMQLIDGGRTLLLGIAGHTNQGAPSYQFAYHSETSYSAAIVAIDLDAVEALPTRTDRFGNAYKYDLPTLPAGPDDPYPDDPFGGRDGLSQAVLEPGSPVRIYSPGYRNAYDLALTESGRLYTVDNGANAGWGSLPENEGGGSVTGRPSDGGFRTDDNLHLVTEGFYGGHPNPIRANPGGAGIYIDGSPSPFGPLPDGWPPVRTGANPVEGDFRNPNRDGSGNNEDGSLYGWDSSTNGLAEYRGSTFDGEMRGDLLTVSFDRHLYRIELDGAGNGVTAVTRLIEDGYGVLGGGIPLDVTAQGDGEPFAGTIWTASYGGEIVAFTPGGGGGGPPTDNDADDDGLNDAVDAFAVDAANGKNTDLAAGRTLTYAFSQGQTPPGPSGSLFNLGFTGLMANGITPFTAQYDATNITAGGATSGFQIDAVPEGDAFAGNDQQYGFQFGVDVLPDVAAFTVEVRLDNPFGGSPSTAPVNWKSQGFFIGNGDQDNYLKVVAAANGGAGGIEVASEAGGAFSSTTYPAGITGGAIGSADTVTLRLAVDPRAGTATPSWTYTAGGASFDGAGAAVRLSGETLAALRGTYERAGEPSALAVGLIATSSESGEPFRAFWDSLSITASGDGSGPPPGGSTTATIGTGPDALVLRVTQDAYGGDAQYTVSVDGVQIGGTLTASALRGSGEADTVTVRGDWGPGDHTVSVSFLNDAWGGTAATDRNLYVEGISYNGAALPGATAVFEREGSQSFAFTETDGGSTPVTTVGSGPDTFDLRVSQDAYGGDAQYTVGVDGAQAGGTLTAQALRAAGASDAVSVRGDWDDGADHTLRVAFLNDACGGTPETDRTLYVESVSYNGAALGGTPVALYSEGSADFFT